MLKERYSGKDDILSKHTIPSGAELWSLKKAQSQFSSQAWWLMLPTAIGEFKFTAGASLGSASCSMSPEMLGADCQTTGPSSTGDKFCGTRVENLLLRLTQQQQQPRSSWWENRWFSAIFVCFAAERWCVCLGTSRKRRKVCWDSWSYYGNHSWNQFPPLCRWVLGIFARPEFPFSLFSVSGTWTEGCGMRKMPNSQRRGLVTITLSFLIFQ